LIFDADLREVGSFVQMSYDGPLKHDKVNNSTLGWLINTFIAAPSPHRDINGLSL
jgi:hypothetical protein